jgi:hypothetical protein
VLVTCLLGIAPAGIAGVVAGILAGIAHLALIAGIARGVTPR